MIKMKIGIVVSEYNYDITMSMLKRAEEQANFLDVKIGAVLQVPGTFDIPLGVKRLLEKKEIEGVVTLGAVIKGETDHDQIIMQNAARKIEDLSVEYSKPVALGISGPNQSRLQAQARIEMAKDAVDSVVKMLKRINEIG
ncbi:MAG: 6,7-dimethyl-8-ribityllumazine synthase [Candidatus Thermoplasmatota archaeon]|jgi:6,7-dimethyl-8-ribityllumazine synthase|nr:6,7-dimethyl-8-ribityllumazine synthase [Candidatus Thermoplasmatota archaeon]